MAYLSFIDDEKLEFFVSDLLKKCSALQKYDPKTFNKNVIDPFSSLFEMGSFELNFEEWRASEIVRQAQKTLSNHVGDFHQNVLGSVKGWENHDDGFDLINEGNKIFSEVKNKHNTMNATGETKLYNDFDNHVMNKNSIYRGFTGYLVRIIPKNAASFNKPFTPSNKDKGTKFETNELIREIDGKSFYALATGEEYAIRLLFEALPKVIYKIKPSINIGEYENVSEYFDKAFSGI